MLSIGMSCELSESNSFPSAQKLWHQLCCLMQPHCITLLVGLILAYMCFFHQPFEDFVRNKQQSVHFSFIFVPFSLFRTWKLLTIWLVHIMFGISYSSEKNWISNFSEDWYDFWFIFYVRLQIAKWYFLFFKYYWLTHSYLFIFWKIIM